jgi:hypothetical protein
MEGAMVVIDSSELGEVIATESQKVNAVVVVQLYKRVSASGIKIPCS